MQSIETIITNQNSLPAQYRSDMKIKTMPGMLEYSDTPIKASYNPLALGFFGFKQQLDFFCLSFTTSTIFITERNINRVIPIHTPVYIWIAEVKGE
jgi:hypothetical protein